MDETVATEMERSPVPELIAFTACIVPEPRIEICPVTAMSSVPLLDMASIAPALVEIEVAEIVSLPEPEVAASIPALVAEPVASMPPVALIIRSPPLPLA